MREVGERAPFEKYKTGQNRALAALTVFDNKDSECTLKAHETNASHSSINALVLKEHLPGEWVVPLLCIMDVLCSHPLTVFFNHK